MNIHAVVEQDQRSGGMAQAVQGAPDYSALQTYPLLTPPKLNLTTLQARKMQI